MACADYGIDVVPIGRLPVAPLGVLDVATVVRRCVQADPSTFSNLVSRLERADVVVNTAGLAAPSSRGAGTGSAGCKPGAPQVDARLLGSVLNGP